VIQDAEYFLHIPRRIVIQVYDWAPSIFGMSELGGWGPEEKRSLNTVDFISRRL